MLKITVEKKNGMIIARWATVVGTGATCQEALSDLGKELDELGVDFRAALREDALTELMGT